VVGWWAGILPEPNIGKHLLRDEGEVVVDEVVHHWVAFTRSVVCSGAGILLLVGALFVDVRLAWVVLVPASRSWPTPSMRPSRSRWTGSW